LPQLQLHSHAIDDPTLNAAIKSKLKSLGKENVAFYLTSPVLRAIVEQLGAAGLPRNAQGGGESHRKTLSDTIFNSARNSTVDNRVLKKERLPHRPSPWASAPPDRYGVPRGTEFFEPRWNPEDVNHVQITAADDGARAVARFIRKEGALRDMIQSHLHAGPRTIRMEPRRCIRTRPLAMTRQACCGRFRIVKPEEVCEDASRP